MIDFVSHFKECPLGVLATRDREGVKTRMFQFLFADDKKLYFSTSSSKAVYKQLEANPNVSFCSHYPDLSVVVSISGKAVFTDDREMKEKILEKDEEIKKIHLTADNPEFKVFYIHVEEVEQFDHFHHEERTIAEKL
ncbi:MAG: pyridoxamine 5'-phosphate oxidase family protein [Lactobacillales bacterium]|jgi:uncharacterized pyridoxamine 5'-phosphate oxidase family protein|nr:pyridoxamine 5'-phosphate oxidase family protein [Lactobacillales bacterium]